MENVRIAILSPHDLVYTFMDNSAPEALHYYDDELHVYVKGTAATFSLSAGTEHEDSQYLVEGNKLAFTYRNRDYYFTIMQVEKNEYEVRITGFSLSFELLNNTVGSYTASKELTFEEYLHIFDSWKIMEIGINEVAGYKLKGDFAEETLLARIYTLENLFNAEVEFIPVLGSNYILKKIRINIYKAHSDSCQGIGEKRKDIVLRYGVDVTGVRKTSDITDLYTAIQPIGKDGITIPREKYEVRDDKKRIEYLSENDSVTLLAVQARERFPSKVSDVGNGYIYAPRKTYEESDAKALRDAALKDLKENCVPKVTYEIEGTAEVNIGDTVCVEDNEFKPELYLEARAVEQVISFTDASCNKTTFSNIKEEKSQISSKLLEYMKQMVDANKVYACSIVTDNGIIFKNGIGETTLTACMMDGGLEVTDKFTICWYKNGEKISTGKTILVSVSDVEETAVYRFEGNTAAGVIRGSCEVTITNVWDAFTYRLRSSIQILKKDALGKLVTNSVDFKYEKKAGDRIVSGKAKLYIEYEGNADLESYDIASAGECVTVNVQQDVTGMRCYVIPEGMNTIVDEIVIPVVSDGAGVKPYKISADASVIIRDSGGLIPETITFTPLRDGNPYMAPLVIEYMIKGWLEEEVVSDSYTFTIPQSAVLIKCSIRAYPGSSSILDEITIPIISAGEAGADAVLYEIRPSVTSIVKRDSIYSPDTVTVSNYKKVADRGYEPCENTITVEVQYHNNLEYEMIAQVVDRSYSFRVPDDTERIRCTMGDIRSTGDSSAYGSVPLAQVTIPVVCDGIDGGNTTSYKMKVNTLVINRKYGSSVPFSPAEIKVSAFSQTGNEELIPYNAYFVIDYEYRSGYISLCEQEGTSCIYTVSDKNGTVLAFRVSMYSDSSKTTLLDQLTIPIVDSGTDGVSPTVTVNADTSLTFKCANEEVTTPVLKGSDGNDGKDSTSYKMLINAASIAKTATGSYKQSSITVQGKKQTGNGVFNSYYCRFKIDTTTNSNLSSATWTNRYTSSSNVSSYTYALPSGITGIRCSMYLAGGTSTLLDQIIIPVVSDGAPGVNGADGTSKILFIQRSKCDMAYKSSDKFISDTQNVYTSSSYSGGTPLRYIIYDYTYKEYLLFIMDDSQDCALVAIAKFSSGDTETYVDTNGYSKSGYRIETLFNTSVSF